MAETTRSPRRRGIHESGVGTVIVTLGAQGAMAISRSGRERMPAPSVAAVDTVGAGDVFCGALVACLARDANLLAALRVAVEAASLSVTRRGTLSSFPSVAEAAAILEHFSVAP